MRRRDFIGGFATLSQLAGGSLGFCCSAWAQQGNIPLIGFLEGGPTSSPDVRRGLAENGFVENRDYVLETAWSNQPAQIAKHAANFVERGAAVVLALGSEAALSAKAATTSVPVVFFAGHDPVAVGLVGSLNKPGSNLTGASVLASELMAKRLEMLREFIPNAKAAIFLVDSGNKLLSDIEIREAETAGQAAGLRSSILPVKTIAEIEPALAATERDGTTILVVGAGMTFFVARDALHNLLQKYAIPTIYTSREFAEAGGLVSFGTRIADAWYLMGVYAARILRGAKPSDLPVQQVTKTELVLNLKAAKRLHLTVPPTLLVRADEVIE